MYYLLALASAHGWRSRGHFNGVIINGGTVEEEITFIRSKMNVPLRYPSQVLLMSAAGEGRRRRRPSTLLPWLGDAFRRFAQRVRGGGEPPPPGWCLGELRSAATTAEPRSSSSPLATGRRSGCQCRLLNLVRSQVGRAGHSEYSNDWCLC